MRLGGLEVPVAMRTGHSEIVRKPASRLCRLDLEVLESRWQPARAWFGMDPLVLPGTGSIDHSRSISAYIHVPENISVGDLDVRINLSYTVLENLNITLTSPTGSSVTLINNDGGASSALDVIFDDEADTRKSVPAMPEAGLRYLLKSSLVNLPDSTNFSVFDNKSALGDWKIVFTAQYPTLDHGFLNSMALGFTRKGDDHGNTTNDASPLFATTGGNLLLSESGRLESSSDVDAFVFIAPTDESAIIRVRNTRNQFISPSFVVSDIETGKTVGISSIESASASSKAITLVAGHRYAVQVSGLKAGNYSLVVKLPPTNDFTDPEGNPRVEEAVPLPVVGNADNLTWHTEGSVNFVGDEDWFKWRAPGSFSIRLQAQAMQASALDPHVEFADASGNNLVNTDPNNPKDTSLSSASLVWNVIGGREYLIKVRAAFYHIGQTGAYSLFLQAIPDDIPGSEPLPVFIDNALESVWIGHGRLETLADTDTFTFKPTESGQIQLDLAGAGMDRLLTDLTISNGSSSGVKVQHTVRKGGRVIAIASVVADQTYKVEARSKRFAPAGQRYGDYQLKVSMFAEAEEGTEPANAKPLVRNEVANSWSIRGRIDLEGDTDIWSWVAPKTMMVSMVMKPATGVGLNPVMTLLDANGVAIPAQSSRSGNAWIISFTATRNRTYFMELKADDAASASEGGIGDYQMNLSQVKDDYGDTLLLGSKLLLNAFDTGLAMGTIGAEDDQDWFVLKPEKTGSLKVSSSTFSGSRQLPMVLITSADPAASSTMANSAVDQTIKAGSTYFVRVTAGPDTTVADSIGSFSISLIGVNLRVTEAEVTQAIVSTGTEELIAAIETTTSTDDVPFIATDVVISTSDTEESTHIDEPIRGSRTVITMGEVERDPVVNLILASPFGKALIATSSIERTIPAGTYPAKKLLPEPVVAVVAPAFAALVRAADAAEYRVLMAIEFAGSSAESILTSMVPSEARTAWRNLMQPPQSTQGVVVPEPASGKSPVSKSSSSFTRWLAGLAVIALVPRQQPTQTTIRGRKKWPSPFGSDFRDHESMGGQT